MPAAKPASATVVGSEGWLSRHLLRIADDLHELDRPYVRWVVCPLLAALAFYLVAIDLFVVRPTFRTADDRVTTGLIWTITVFVGLNALWLARRLTAFLTARPLAPPNPPSVAAEVRSLGTWLAAVGLATLTSWLVLAPFGELDVRPMAVWGLIAGLIVLLAGRSLRKLRRPGVLPLVLAMVPLSPSVLLGLPVGLIALRMLSRPEIRSFLDAKPAGLDGL